MKWVKPIMYSPPSPPPPPPRIVTENVCKRHTSECCVSSGIGNAVTQIYNTLEIGLESQRPEFYISMLRVIFHLRTDVLIRTGRGVGGLCVPRKGDEFFQKRNKPKPCSLVIFLLALVQLLVQVGGGAGKYLDENNNRNQPCWLGSSALVFILHSELNTAMTCFFLTLRCNIKIDFSFIAIVYYSY